MSRYDKTQDGLADVGAMMAPNLMVRWERREDRILLRGVSHSMHRRPRRQREPGVENSVFPSVIQAFPSRRGEAGPRWST
jgi:hypothetical protein